jgi:geranylgeranyl diphosphate synthase type I
MSVELIDQMNDAVQRDLRHMAELLDLDQLHEMVAHHFGWSDGQGAGKGIRPLLCLLTCASAGGDWRLAVPAATGVELIHNFSLIHDDIQDGSELRRHRPTVWKLWGDAQAINTGDALFALARLSAHRLTESGIPSETVLRIQRWIDEACLELTKGQHLDLAFDTATEAAIDRYLRMIEAKTSSLLAASAAAGAGIANAGEAQLQAYRTFGHLIGLAFQILDDVLGVWGIPDETGKSAVDDLVTRKPTYVALYGLKRSPDFADLWGDPSASVEELIQALDEVGAHEAARQAAASKTRLALESLDEVEAQGQAASALRSVADRLLERQS